MAYAFARACSASVLVASCVAAASGGTLEVGPGRTHATPAAALAAAKSGDTILVHAPADGAAYAKVALLMRTPNVRIVAARDADHPDRRVRLTGDGFDYAGAGSVPRAIVQFDPGADGCALEGFELSGARNGSHNGAGVRINQASHVTVRECVIHDNDMGVMSNGNGTAASAVDQRIERCHIYSNGTSADPGYNHNLYLGGTSVVVSACDIHGSTTGHNLKSRAHHTRVEYCWIHDAANREIDLVDAKGDTDTPRSDAVLLGCVIVKQRPEMTGNRGVVHFGQDGGHGHTGTLHVVNCAIVTPYVAPVFDLSAPETSLLLVNSIVTDGGAGQRGQVLLRLAGANAGTPRSERVRGHDNVFAAGFSDVGALGADFDGPIKFAGAERGDFRIVASPGRPIPAGAQVETLTLPGAPGRENDRPGVPLLRYAHPCGSAPRPDDAAPLPGAGELAPRS